jgi:hypothetical protein
MKKILPVLAVFILAGAGGFFGGMKYQQGETPFGPGMGKFQNMQNGNSEQGSQNNGFGTKGSSFSGGEIVSKDSQGLTIKATGGSSKIVFYSTSTQVQKTSTTTVEVLKKGDSVTVIGKTNDDGSITAQTIQLR